MLAKLESADFVAVLNQPFELRLEASRSLEMELLEVTELGLDSTDDQPSSKRRPFSIVFRGPREPLLPQRIHRVAHEKLGALDLFLVPIGPDHDGMCYEAVFT